MVIGLLLICGALGLMYYNRAESDKAGKAAEEVETRILEAMTEGTAVFVDDRFDNSDIPDIYTPMEVCQVDEARYIGIISVPSMNISLPVQENWDYRNLKVSPCRYSGSFKTGELVICAHNYDKHFGPLRRARTGEEVIFTSVTGESYRYVISNVEIVEPTDIDYMVESNGHWDLTLFTCTTGGNARCAVRCERTE